MSLIVARKENNQIAIVSDTKLTYPNHEVKRQKDSPVEGVIKTIILNDNICISFAGEIENAENAFLEIGEGKPFAEIIDILFRYHKKSNHKTEFLVCSGKPKPLIHKIKNGESKEVNSSWIGDSNAFNSFQGSMMGTKKLKEINKPNQSNNKAGISITGLNLSFEVEMPVQLFSKMSSAMDDVIEDSNVDSVGGFKVIVIYNEGFRYVNYGKLYRENIEIIGKGGFILGHGSATEGAYSINFIGASKDNKRIALHLQQGNFGIIYTRNNSGLLKPKLFHLDEIDFIDYLKDNHNIEAEFETQNRIEKFIKNGLSEFEKNNFIKAKAFFDKGLLVAKGKKEAEILFYKGICLLNLKEIQNAMLVFQKAINIDSSYQQKILQVLSQKR